MIELDVSLTKDGKVFVYHDLELVHEVKNVKIATKDFTYAELITEHLRPVNRDLLSAEYRLEKIRKFFEDEPDPMNRLLH